VTQQYCRPPVKGRASSDSDHSDGDDSVPESIGKAISEPFKSD